MSNLADNALKLTAIALAAAFLASPLLEMPQVNDWLFRIATLIMLATSWNLMASAGLISLGHSAFWGVGSYAAILSANSGGLPVLVSLGFSAVFGALLGIFLAIATGRLRGIFFAISTLALSEGLRVAAFMLPDVTGGAIGLFLNAQLRPSLDTLYFIGAVGAVLSVLIAYLLSQSRFHFACRAMRNNEPAAQMLGINPFRYRMALLAISGAMASCAGGLNAWYGGYLDPGIGFNLHFTILAQIAPILGGIYTIAGPVVGSVVIVAISEGTRILLGEQQGVSQLLYGVILITGILLMPKGLWGAVTAIGERTRAQGISGRAGLAAASKVEAEP